MQKSDQKPTMHTKGIGRNSEKLLLWQKAYHTEKLLLCQVRLQGGLLSPDVPAWQGDLHHMGSTFVVNLILLAGGGLSDVELPAP